MHLATRASGHGSCNAPAALGQRCPPKRSHALPRQRAPSLPLLPTVLVPEFVRAQAGAVYENTHVALFEWKVDVTAVSDCATNHLLNQTQVARHRSRCGRRFHFFVQGRMRLCSFWSNSKIVHARMPFKTNYKPVSILWHPNLTLVGDERAKRAHTPSLPTSLMLYPPHLCFAARPIPLHASWPASRASAPRPDLLPA